jgi:hypothetical protein
MRIVMYGHGLGAYGHPTEYPFLLNGRIERIWKNSKELQDLEADIAICNYSRPQEVDPVHGWNYSRLPKVKVQLVIQGEHYNEYLPEWVDSLTHNFDGNIGFDCNRPFWDKYCTKPTFYLDPFVMWNGFYKGPVSAVNNYGYVLGGSTEHRENMIKKNPSIKYMIGDCRTNEMQEELKRSGIGYNVHKYLGHIKTESSRLTYYLNLGLSVVSEKLDETFPKHFVDSVVEVDDISNYVINKEQLINCAKNTEKVFKEHHDLNTELDNLLNNIIKQFGLK